MDHRNPAGRSEEGSPLTNEARSLPGLCEEDHREEIVAILQYSSTVRSSTPTTLRLLASERTFGHLGSLFLGSTEQWSLKPSGSCIAGSVHSALTALEG